MIDKYDLAPHYRLNSPPPPPPVEFAIYDSESTWQEIDADGLHYLSSTVFAEQVATIKPHLVVPAVTPYQLSGTITMQIEVVDPGVISDVRLRLFAGTLSPSNADLQSRLLASLNKQFEPATLLFDNENIGHFAAADFTAANGLPAGTTPRIYWSAASDEAKAGEVYQPYSQTYSFATIIYRADQGKLRLYCKADGIGDGTKLQARIKGHYSIHRIK